MPTTDGRTDHERALDLAIVAIDFQLDPDEDRWLTAHLDVCPSCRRTTDLYRGDARAIERLPDTSSPDRVRAGIRDAIETQPRRGPSPLLRLAGVGAVAIVVASLVVLRTTTPDLPGTGAPTPPSSPSAAASVTPRESPSPGPSASPSASPVNASPTGAGAAVLRWRTAMVPPDGVIEARGIAVGQRVALASLVGTTTRTLLWWTRDGRQWNDAALAADTFGGSPPFLIVPYRDRFVALGWKDRARSVTERRIWLSTDGVAWRPDRDPSGTLGSFMLGLLVAGDNLLLAGGRAASGDNVLWSSTDGIGWTRLDLGSTFSRVALNDLASDGTSFYAVGSIDGTGAIWRTTDGGRWTRLPAPPDGVDIDGLVASPVGLVAFGSSAIAPLVPNVAWWSQDGQRWETVRMPPLPASQADEILRIARTGSGLLAVWQLADERGVRAARSVDGRTWEFLDVRGIRAGIRIAHVHEIDSTLIVLGLDERGDLVAFWAPAPG